MTPALTHSDYAALLRACAAMHDEDTPRLVLADWLEENDDPARGELIRVQIELARWDRRFSSGRVCRLNQDCASGKCEYCRKEFLQARESALLREHSARWRRGEKCPECDVGWKNSNLPYPSGRTEYKCPACHGTGWERWWLSEREPVSYGVVVREGGWRHRVHFERGFIEQVDCNLTDIFRDEKPTEWSLAVVRGEPGLRRFGVVDRVPGDYTHEDGGESFTFTVRTENQYEVNRDIPRKLFNALVGGKRNRDDWMIRFDSPAAANRALAEAAWRVVKRQAE